MESVSNKKKNGSFRSAVHGIKSQLLDCVCVCAKVIIELLTFTSGDQSG